MIFAQKSSYIILLLLLSSCKSSYFRTSMHRFLAETAKSTKRDNNQPMIVDLGCTSGLDKVIRVGAMTGADYPFQNSGSIDLTIKGSFCGLQNKEPLNILFIIDHSTSMLQNDPEKNGSCGRLQAVEKTLANYKATDNVHIGTIAFSGGIIEASTQPLTSLELFQKSLMVTGRKQSTFCGQQGKTNYEASFIRAHQAIDKLKGRKIIYFITDGIPSVSVTGDDPVAAARARMQSLQTIRDTKVLGFYLNNGPKNLAAYNTLVKIIGDQKNVIYAHSAEQLTKEISTIHTTGFVRESLKITLGPLPHQASKTIKNMKENTAGNASKDDFDFETEPLRLTGDQSRPMEYAIDLTANDVDGGTHIGKLRVMYQQ